MLPRSERATEFSLVRLLPSPIQDLVIDLTNWSITKRYLEGFQAFSRLGGAKCFDLSLQRCRKGE